jgi:uncharacterized protein (TIGR02145 family)
MKKTSILLGIILMTNSCFHDDCPETIERVLIYPVDKMTIDNSTTRWYKTSYLFSNISFVMELNKSGGRESCEPYTTNAIHESSVRLLCNKPLYPNGISIPAYVDIKEYFDTNEDCYVAGYIEGYIYTLKTDYRSIFQNDRYTIIVEAKSSKNELFKDSCMVTINSEDSIVFNPRLTYGTVNDNDNNTYKTIVIGNQTWMAENLRTRKYANGELIGTTTPSTLDISKTINPRYQWASGSEEGNAATSGRLYTWYTVTDSRNLCPDGWHIPSREEWDTLTTYLGIHPIAHKMREENEIHWSYDPNYPTTNESGFTALPSGRREASGKFECKGPSYWWTNTAYDEENSFYFTIGWDGSIPEPYVYAYPKSSGFSVRCIKD